MSLTHHLLKTYWGYDHFRPLQEEIIDSILTGNDTLALLPTGGGKSICFQIPAMAMEGICIVVTPLIALMKDQVEQLKKRKIPAVAVYSGLNAREIDILLDNCIFGNIKFLYVSPERLKTELLIERAQRMKVNLLAVDEAHCISQWGYDFRPPYLEIAKFRSFLPLAKVIALTASATKEVEIDIIEKLELQNLKIFRKSFFRDNLSYSCFYEENKIRKLLYILKQVQGTSIVYVKSRKRTKEIAQELYRNGIKADYYHGGLSNNIRSHKQEEWMQNKIRVIVATNAFGMGIDKPDVRTVIHLDLPDNLEAYYQEAGRAGRDEKKAYPVILYNSKDIEGLKTKIIQEYPPIDFIRRVYQSLANYLKIAVGSSYLASFDFDLEDFQKTFSLEPVPTYYSIKKLEQEGFIQLNESYHNPSKLFIPVENKILYEYLIAHINHDALIKIILRMYGGELYSTFISISESEISRNIKLPQKEVVKQLNQLHQKNIVIYDPSKDKPQLTFTTARFDASKLPLNSKAIEERRQRDLKKVDAVINYTQHLFKCRSKLLLEYFDEEASHDCGICDNCLSKKRAIVPKDSYSKFRIKALEVLQEKELSISQLLEILKPANEKEFILNLKTMINTFEIRYLDNGKIGKTGKN